MDYQSDRDADRRLHRTWVQLLLDSGYKEISSIAVDADVRIVKTRFEYWEGQYGEDHAQASYRIDILVPTSSYSYVMLDEENQTTMLWAMQAVANEERLLDMCPELIPPDLSYDRLGLRELTYSIGVKTVDPEPDWQDRVRKLILGHGINNQGRISEIVKGKRQEQPILYNEMKFASQSEVRIAQALERKGVLFFPLPLAVRHKTGNKWQDHREADFIVCNDGKWGILEVAHHSPDRYEQDAEKSDWWKQSGVLCVQHYTAERSYNEPDKVVAEFLSILSKY